MTFESNRRLTLLSTVVASMIATLSACGGGGDGTTTATSTTSASSSSPSHSTSESTAAPTATETADSVTLAGPPAEDSQAASAIPEGFQNTAEDDASPLGDPSLANTLLTDATAATASPTEDAAYYAPGGATSSSSTPTATPTSTSTSTSGSSVVSTDIVQRLRASSIDTYKYAGLQCQGKNSYFWEWGGQSAYLRSPLPNPLYGSGSFKAFSTGSSPSESGKYAFRWELHRSDPDTAGSGAKRCEFGLGYKLYNYPGKVYSTQVGLPKNKDFWWAVAVNAGDWRSSGSNDTQILWQWHDAYGGGLPPFLSLMTSGNYMWMQLTHDMHSSPSAATLTRVNPWRISGWKPNTWLRFVVQARKDTSTPSNGYVRVWLNGTQIVDYKGPFGYNVTQMDYAKVGIYHWISSQNAWNSSYPTRVMYTKGPVQVNHRTGYTWQSINSLLD